MLETLLTTADDGLIELISVDIFDTLIFREVDHPDDILRQVASRAIAQGLLAGDDVDFFVQQRRWAEKYARAQSFRASGSSEVNLDLIYEHISGSPRLLSCLEEEEEIRRWFLNDELLASLIHLQSNGKKIVLVSDMYLSETLITDYLKREAVGLDIVDVRVSSQRGTSKADGKAFDQLLNDYGLEGINVLHIGDNFVDDIQMAASRGLRTYFLPKPSYLIEIMRLEDSIESGSTRGLSRLRRQLVSQYPALETPSFEVLGACVFGPVLVAWARWIILTCQNNGITELYCLLREGEIVAETINALGSNLAVKTLAISRRSSYLPSLGELTPETLFSLSGRRGYCLSELAEDVGQALPSELIPYGGECLSTLVGNDVWQKILQWTGSLASNIQLYLTEQKRFLHRYLIEQGLKNSGNQALLDWGCGGSLVATISRLLNLQKSHFFLYYYKESALELLSRGKLHLFQPSSLEFQSRAIAASPEICEILLNQQLNSTTKYREHNSRIYPVSSMIPSQNVAQLERFKKGIDSFVAIAIAQHWLEQGVNVDCRKRLFTILYRLIEYPLRSEALLLACLRVPLSGSNSVPVIPHNTKLSQNESVDQLWRNYQKGVQGLISDCWWVPGFVALKYSSFLLQQGPFSRHVSDQVALGLLAETVRARGAGEVIVYGAGEFGRQLGMLLMQGGITIAFYIDRRAREGALTLLGRPVENLDQLELPDAVPIVIASRAFSGEIYEALTNKNPGLADIVIRL